MKSVLISNFAASLFALLNPLGILPFFISYTQGEKRSVQRWLALFVSLTCLMLLLVFFFAGSSLLQFLGISLDSLRIAGGILLLIIVTRILGLLVASIGVQSMIAGLSNVIVHSLAPEILKNR